MSEESGMSRILERESERERERRGDWKHFCQRGEDFADGSRS